MRCPECKKEIRYVRIYSECYRRGYFQEKTNRIKSYGSIRTENVEMDITEVDCPKCGRNIIKAVEMCN
ncbi:hypothetical protein ES703_08238 [subsurface metagenome]